MRHFHRLIVVAALAAAPTTLLAHSLSEVESMLGSRERYFQAADQPAPKFSLEDAEGNKVGLADLRGKVVVLNFVYTHCPDVCPLHAERIAEIQAMINQTPMKDLVRFVSVTTDPRRDTPAIMRDYGPTHGLEPVNWTFLTSGPTRPDDTTRRLAESYGLKFTRTEHGYQMHAVVTHVIDGTGRLRARFHGLKFAPVNLVVFINALINQASAPHDHPEQGLWGRLRGLIQ